MPTKQFKAAEIFPPGDYIREELEVRGWTQGDLARVINRPARRAGRVRLDHVADSY